LPSSKGVNTSPPPKELIFDEDIIPMSRLADIGDLKMKLQNLSGIQMKNLRVCKKEDIPTISSDAIPFTKVILRFHICWIKNHV
jgi:hypothetical protein